MKKGTLQDVSGNAERSAQRQGGSAEVATVERSARGSRAVGELEWQARWFAGDFGREFVSTDGVRVHVIQFGTWNRMAGPDFVDTAVSLNGGAAQSGAVELDLDVQDWERHGHSVNPEYNEVALHVFVNLHGETRFFTRTLNHRNVPQIRLGTPVQSWVPGNLGCVARSGRCAVALGALSPGEMEGVLLEAAEVRFRRKATAIARTRDIHGAGEALYQAVAAGLGYVGNELPFTLIAQRVPVWFLGQNRNLIEPLLFGVGGMIPEPILSGLMPEARRLAQELWEGWWPHRTLHGRSRIEPSLWRLGRQRPNNHPQRRLAALACIAKHWRAVLRLSDSRDWNGLRSLLLGMEHSFWSTHMTFQTARQRERIRLLGNEKVQDLLVNAFMPAADDWSGLLKVKGCRDNLRLRIAAARLLSGRADRRALLGRVICQQGLIELHEVFCRRDVSDCVACVFPEQMQSR